METNNQQNAEPDGAYPKAPEGPLHSFHLKPETRNFKKVVKHTFWSGCSKTFRCKARMVRQSLSWVYRRAHH